MVIVRPGKVNGIGPVSDGGEAQLALDRPYVAHVSIRGDSPILFHAWNVESVEQKSRASKGSKAKKSDDVESYVYRDMKGEICIPGEYLRGSIINAAKYQQDPRSSRKSAMDLFKAGVISLTDLASLGKKEWDYLDQRRVTVQRSGITRLRPAFGAGWQASFDLQVQLPEYIRPDFLHHVLQDAGRLVGLADFRPTYGRFSVTLFDADLY